MRDFKLLFSDLRESLSHTLNLSMHLDHSNFNSKILLANLPMESIFGGAVKFFWIP